MSKVLQRCISQAQHGVALTKVQQQMKTKCVSYNFALSGAQPKSRHVVWASAGSILSPTVSCGPCYIHIHT